jgi:hypothetical protein
MPRFKRCLLETTQSDKVIVSMKLYRSIVLILILVLASSPALAAVCAISCATESVVLSLHANDMSGMQHCHEGSMTKDTNKPHSEHKHCAMGAGCHFSQVIFSFDGLSNYIYADLSSASFPKFVPSENSRDLSPPLKPPA